MLSASEHGEVGRMVGGYCVYACGGDVSGGGGGGVDVSGGGDGDGDGGGVDVSGGSSGLIVLIMSSLARMPHVHDSAIVYICHSRKRTK